MEDRLDNGVRAVRRCVNTMDSSVTGSLATFVSDKRIVIGLGDSRGQVRASVFGEAKMGFSIVGGCDQDAGDVAQAQISG